VFCELHGHWTQDCKRVKDWKKRIEKLKTKEEMLAKLDANQAKADADRKVWREELEPATRNRQGDEGPTRNDGGTSAGRREAYLTGQET
jgi:hypothetical protein